MYTTMSEAIAAFESYMSDFHGLVLDRWEVTEIMRELDPIMYLEHFLDWLDGEGIDPDSL